MKECKHCSALFEPNRRNHLYCKRSCSSLASYERNKYRYVPGHYVKGDEDKEEGLKKSSQEVEVLPSNEFVVLEEKIDKLLKGGVSGDGITNAALGNAASDGAVTVFKTVFAPHLLNANKGDVEKLMVSLNEIKRLLVANQLKESGLWDLNNY